MPKNLQEKNNPFRDDFVSSAKDIFTTLDT